MTSGNIRVLYAEDDPGDRAPCVAFLRFKGLDVTEVMHPEQAKNCLRDAEPQFNIVVLDLVMPEDDPKGGEKVLAFMKKERIMVPVILATAWGYNGPAKQAREAHVPLVREILTKTFLPSELLRSIQRVVKQWEIEKEKYERTSPGGKGGPQDR